MSNERAYGMVANFGICYLGRPSPFRHQNDSLAEAERQYAGAYLAVHRSLYGKAVDPDFRADMERLAADTRKALGHYRSRRAKRSR